MDSPATPWALIVHGHGAVRLESGGRVVARCAAPPAVAVDDAGRTMLITVGNVGTGAAQHTLVLPGGRRRFGAFCAVGAVTVTVAAKGIDDAAAAIDVRAYNGATVEFAGGVAVDTLHVQALAGRVVCATRMSCRRLVLVAADHAAVCGMHVGGELCARGDDASSVAVGVGRATCVDVQPAAMAELAFDSPPSAPADAGAWYASQCVVCMAEPATVAAAGCCHAFACRQCYAHAGGQSFHWRCPLCRGPFGDIRERVVAR